MASPEELVEDVDHGRFHEEREEGGDDERECCHHLEVSLNSVVCVVTAAEGAGRWFGVLSAVGGGLERCVLVIAWVVDVLVVAVGTFQRVAIVVG